VTEYADLEIGLHRRDDVTWRVELRLDLPGTDADWRSDSDGRMVVTIDPNELPDFAGDDQAYGRALGSALLDGHVGRAFQRAVDKAQGQGVTLRVRLLIGPSASRLHALRWEALRNPRDGSPLLTDENIVFSRYLSSMDWRQVGPQTRSSLRALVVVAGPSNVVEYGPRDLAPVDVADEIARAKDGLHPIPVTVIGGDVRATEERLFAELHEAPDILYLVCHGYRMRGDDPILLLEQEDGTATTVRAAALVEQIQDLSRVPRLVVLASCQSAGDPNHRHSDDGGVLAALGPRLAEVGVPAVLSMQGNVTMTTIARFMPVFFRELQRDGRIDRATAAARAAVRGRDDWWVPALFMRLRTGRLWYPPGVGLRGEAFEQFPSLISEIANRKCTPILGPGLADQLLGSRQQIAQRWAESFRFPMAPHFRDDLPQVAQYLQVSMRNIEFPRDELRRYLCNELIGQYGNQLPDAYRACHPEDVPLHRLLTDAWQVRHESGATDPFAVLAELPLPLYVTTQPYNLLAEALRAAGRDPQVETCRWKELRDEDPWGSDPDLDVPEWAFRRDEDAEERAAARSAGWPTSVFDRQKGYRPDPRRPLVYHLFGHSARPRSVVLTEDDYFDFLIGATRNKDLIPPPVRRSFADSSLMFLGFRLDEWDFRVLYRSILSQEGNLRGRHTNVAVQIDPEEGRITDPDRARDYLERYFQNSAITIYWGSTESFIKELHDHWTSR
jgi:hypothetical protein